MITTRLLATALVATALTLSLQAPERAQAQGLTGTYTLNKIAFQGNSQIATSDLEAALPVQVGQKIDQAGLQQDADAVAALYRKRNVGASITTRLTVLHKTKADVLYVLAEQAPVAPTVTHVGVTADTVSVTGNSKVTTADILAAANIKPGQTVTNPQITAAQNAVLALYKKANVGAEVSADWTDVSPQHIAMVFKIVEKSDN